MRGLGSSDSFAYGFMEFNDAKLAVNYVAAHEPSPRRPRRQHHGHGRRGKEARRRRFGGGSARVDR